MHVEQVIADRKNYPAQNDLLLPARTRQLEFDYSGLSFVVPSRVFFRYMLEGYDHQWQEPGTRRAAFYNELRPGKYTFRVIACNDSGAMEHRWRIPAIRDPASLLSDQLVPCVMWNCVSGVDMVRVSA